MFKLFKKKETPNCTICEWEDSKTTQVSGLTGVCLAQGKDDSLDVYNNRLCKKLFRVKDSYPKLERTLNWEPVIDDGSISNKKFDNCKTSSLKDDTKETVEEYIKRKDKTE